MRRIVTLGFVVVALALPHAANAVTLGADQLLGIVVPGTPADEPNELEMVNGLIEGWVLADGTIVDGYNDGAVSGTNMGDNPNDDDPPEEYILKYSATTVVPDPAPLADTYIKSGENPSATFTLTGTYDWVLAKWGNDAAVYYIGNLASGTEVTLTMDGTGFTGKAGSGGGLSHYTLFNGTPTSVPDGGMTLSLLGLALAGIGVARRYMRT